MNSILLALLSGLLYVFSFAPWDQGYLQWFAFIPLLIAVQILPASNKKKIFGLGYILSLSICLGGFYWIVYATQQYGGLPLPAALGVFFVFCALGQLQVPLYLLLRKVMMQTPTLQKHRWLWIVISGFVYAGIESLYPKLFLDTAGNAFYRSVYFRQAADIGGPFFLTTLVVTFAELTSAAILMKNSGRKLRYGIAAVFILFASTFYGFVRVQQIQTLAAAVPEELKLRVSMIQANIGDFMKVAAERGTRDAGDQVIERYLGLSREAIKAEKTPDLVVWPETAYPAIFDKPFTAAEKRMDDQLRAFAREFNTIAPHGTFVFGGYDQDAIPLDYNSLFYFQNPLNGPSIKRVYHKAVLLMFGETLPFSEMFPSMKSWFPTMGFFGRGPGAEVTEVKNARGDSFKLASSICYEGLFTDHSVDGAKLGADVLLNVTNDSWFGPLGEPYLHLELTTFRSIETRLPMLRATNTGFTVVVDATGELTQSTGLSKTDVLMTAVTPKLDLVSPYVAISRYLGSNWYVRLCQVLLISILFGMAVTRRRDRQ
jgi:apolipoprotein N-acyltransferase